MNNNDKKIIMIKQKVIKKIEIIIIMEILKKY